MDGLSEASASPAFVLSPLCFQSLVRRAARSLAGNGIDSAAQDKLRSEHPEIKFDF